MNFEVTIYSPADGEAHRMVMLGDRNKRIVAMTLLMDSMESGGWFKIERTS
jgi:accessory gene regulator protein AgrB